MDKQKKLKIALPILVVVMAVVWGPVITGGGSNKKSKSVKNNAQAHSKQQGSSADLVVLARSNERKEARTSFEEWGRNPFTLSASPKASVLEGIMWDSVNPKAIINGFILGVGDKVGGGEITDIKQNSVTIKTESAEKTYTLGQ